MKHIREATRGKVTLLKSYTRASFSPFYRKLIYNNQIKLLRDLTRKFPLFLEIETTNICNASCVFCSYPNMKRKKGVMSMLMFQKVVDQYAKMGGGAVSLTPPDGEPFLDPHLFERLEILKKYQETQQVVVTTNGIALAKYSDQEIRRLLQDFFLIKFSIGGLDEATYKSMFNVDRFSQVMNEIDRLLKLRDDVSNPSHISFAFRTNDPRFETNFKPQLDKYREKDIDISHLNVFTNNCGSLKNEENNRIVIGRGLGKKRLTCVYPCMSMVICWDGTVTACCEDAEDCDLMIGNVENNSLSEIWFGVKRLEFLDSFTKHKLITACLKCSAYQPDTVFADPCFRGLQPHQKLPKDFIQFR